MSFWSVDNNFRITCWHIRCIFRSLWRILWERTTDFQLLTLLPQYISFFLYFNDTSNMLNDFLSFVLVDWCPLWTSSSILTRFSQKCLSFILKILWFLKENTKFYICMLVTESLTNNFFLTATMLHEIHRTYSCVIVGEESGT